MPNKKRINKRKKKLDLFNKRVYRKRVNNENRQDSLETLKAHYTEQIRAKENELAVLKAKLAELVGFANELKTIERPGFKPNKYADTGLTEAILDVVTFICKTRSNAGKGVDAARIKSHLLANGFKRTEQFSVAVSVTLGRLIESGRILVTESNGHRMYRAKEDFRGTGGGL